MDILSNLKRLRWTPGTLGLRTTYYLPDGRHMSIVKLKARYNFTDKDQYETLMSDSTEEHRHDSLNDIADYINLITQTIES
jgi:hypothetical protein